MLAELGERVRAARAAARLTQQELGGRVCLTRTSIANIEAGRQGVDVELLLMLAQATGTSAVELLAASAGDWTAGSDGQINASARYRQVVADVEATIRGSADHLIAGRADAVARLIVSRLAHTHGLAPRTEEADRDR